MSNGIEFFVAKEAALCPSAFRYSGFAPVLIQAEITARS
jgi:hypothetical protein